MKRKFLKAALLLFIVFLLAVGFSSLTFRQKTNDLPLSAQYRKGAFHMHSNYSDGLGSVDEIARDARAQNLDFVILTDHGEPNLQSSAATAWKDGILLIGASEFSLHAGHMAAAGYRVPDYIFPPESQEAIGEVDRDGGVTFISHPLDGKIPWTDWHVRGFSGIEILSLYQMAKKNFLRGLTLFPLQYLLNPDYALTAMISYPQKEMDIWDRFNRVGKYFGIYALDSHAKLPISRKLNLHFPSYAATFRILSVYVKVEDGLDADANATVAAAALIAAMRRGSFFNVIESLAPANGFEHYYLEPDGRHVEMGSPAQNPGGSLIFELPFAFATDIVVKKDGAVFAAFRANTRPELSMPITQNGVYRAEISLASGRFKELPWIMTNPIFVACPAPGKVAPVNVAAVVATEGENYFSVEKNGRTLAVMSRDPGAEAAVTALSFTLRAERAGDPDFWAALAHRQPLAVKGLRGFVFETRANRRLRGWLQFRTDSGAGEAAYRHSFLAETEWHQVVIPFSAFHCLYGQPAVPAPLDIASFFFLIDGSNAYPGAQGEIFFRRIGLY